jgi:hypothetical protein
VAQEVEQLSGKCKALSSICSTAKRKGKRQWKGGKEGGERKELLWKPKGRKIIVNPQYPWGVNSRTPSDTQICSFKSFISKGIIFICAVHISIYLNHSYVTYTI